MGLAILVDCSTNRLSGLGLDVHIVSKLLSLLGEDAVGDLEWPRMSSNLEKLLFYMTFDVPDRPRKC